MGIYKNQIRSICNAINAGFSSDEKMRAGALRNLERTINSMADYIAAVTAMESGLQIARFRMEGQEFRDYVSDLDKKRRNAHEAMMGFISSTNRICGMVNCDLLYSGDAADRYAVADFAQPVVCEIFAERTGKGKFAHQTLSEITGEDEKT